MIAHLHHELVFKRRVRVLADLLGRLLPPKCSVLDVGCGDGLIDRLVMSRRPDLTIQGIDVLVRPRPAIPVRAYDGERFPLPDGGVDATLFVDVLHHTPDPEVLLREAHRVSRRWVVIKDHLRDGPGAAALLRLMDWVGNAPHGVALPYNYWPQQRWQAAFARQRWEIKAWVERLGLYPWPGSLIFDQRLHFLAVLDVRKGH